VSDKRRTCLSEVVPSDFYVELNKVTDEGTRLLIEITTGGTAPSHVLHGEDFDEFRTLLQKANRQLYEAKIRGLTETFFISLDLLYYLAPDPDAIRNTFWQLDSEDHCNINYVYHVESSVTCVKPWADFCSSYQSGNTNKGNLKSG